MDQITLRPLDLETDATRYVELVNTILPKPVTEDRVREWDRNFPRDGIRAQNVALNQDQIIVACNEASRRPNMSPGTFFVEVIVAPEFQRRGIGARLYDDAVACARANGATRLTCEVRDHNPDWLRFAQTRGFAIDRHIFESTLDLKSFDESRFAGWIEAVEKSGIRFFTLADVGNTEEHQRRLHALNRKNALDIPGWEGEFPRFEDFSKYAFQTSWFRAEGQILAADDGEWIGLGAVGYFAATNSEYNMHTDVLKANRGRHIARAQTVDDSLRARVRRGLHSHEQRFAQRADPRSQSEFGLSATTGIF